MKAREGDFIETEENLIFDVKGLVHPAKRVVAFIRYFPDENGKRTRRGKPFGKVYPLSKRYELLKHKFPEYLVYDPVFDETLCEVPVAKVKKHYKPTKKLEELRSSKAPDMLEAKAVQFAELLKEAADIPWRALGISGSILIGLHTVESDIDPVVYGSENCRKVHSALRSLFEDKQEVVRPYKLKELKTLFDFRSKDTWTGFEDFLKTESRKVMQGKFKETDFFIRFIKGWDEMQENYGDIQYQNLGNGKIEAKIVDDSESAFTPCTYEVETLRSLDGLKGEHIEEITSFRGRFCEHAQRNETVIAQGKIERVMDKRQNHEHSRLLVGGKPTDYIALS